MLVTNNFNFPINKLKKTYKTSEASQNKVNIQTESDKSLTTSSILGTEFIKAHYLPFKGSYDFTDICHMKGETFLKGLKSVKKEFQGAGIFDKDFIDWNKIGWDCLKQEPIDWNKATNKEIFAYWQALALAETKDERWVRIYNPTNVPQMLATNHTIMHQRQMDDFTRKANEVSKIAHNRHEEVPKPVYLDQPIINPDTGELNVPFVVFDTETTGVKIYDETPNADKDKVVQIAAVRVNPGESVKSADIIDQYINPEMHIPDEVSDIHHIDDAMVSDKPIVSNKKFLKNFVDTFLGDNLIVAYNAQFDMQVLKNGIDEYNTFNPSRLKEKSPALVLDPFILIQRLHPFVGVRKTLSSQYRYFFGQDLEGAHDAFVDAKATVNMLNYCCNYLNKHYHPKNPNDKLTVKDVLMFQYGQPIEGLDIDIENTQFDRKKSFNQSYMELTYLIKNFHDGYKITPELLSLDKCSASSSQKCGLVEEIGQENAEILEKKMLNKFYRTKKNFKKALRLSRGLKPYTDPKSGETKSLKDIINTVVRYSDCYAKDEDRARSLWMKNIKPSRPSDHPDGKVNDLPDIEIIRKVMKNELKIEKPSHS